MLRTAFTAVIVLAYPFAVYFGLGATSPRWIAGVLGVIALLRLSLLKGTVDGRWIVAFGVVIAATMITNDALPLRLYPALANVVLLAFFSWGLYRPPTVVERIARRGNKHLSEPAVAYTRRVTIVWCIFFALNGSVAFYTALWTTPVVWSLYNGLIAYVLVGLLYTCEYAVRLKVMRAHHG